MTDNPDPKQLGLWKQFFYFFGPILASFHVASYIVGFFSVGAVARWIIEQWFPFTRLIWTNLLTFLGNYIYVPILNDVEKDALTTMVFFAPLGLYALFSRAQHPLDSRYRTFAVFIGLFFVFVVGSQLVFNVATSVIDTIGVFPGTKLGIVVFFGISLFAAWVFIYGDLRKLERVDNITYVIVLAFVLLINLIVQVTEGVSNLGFITFFCFALVMILASLAVYKTPYRLSWSLGSLIFFVSSGLIFEIVLLLITFIEGFST